MYKPASHTHLRAHETTLHLVCRLLLEKKNLTSPSTLHSHYYFHTPPAFCTKIFCHPS